MGGLKARADGEKAGRYNGGEVQRIDGLRRRGFELYESSEFS
jgi:hypothetical protein